MSLAATPSSSSSSSASRRMPIWIYAAAFLVVAGLAYAAWGFFRPGQGDDVFVGNFQPVSQIDLDVRLNKDGELQAINNLDVVNQVEGFTMIQTLVPEGTFVHKGDVLVTLDSSAIQKEYDQSLLELQTAEAALSAAKEAKEIQESTNNATLQEAIVALKVAELSLREYADGTSKALENEAATKVKMAEIMLKNKEEDLSITRGLFAKGFVTLVDVKKGELEVLTCQNDLHKAQADLMVMRQYTQAKEFATKESTVAQAKMTVERTKRENNASLNRYKAALAAAQQTLELRQLASEKNKEQLANCTIKAPGDGLVVYASSSDRSGAEPIKEGGNVRKRQVLCRLPDTTQMKAVVRVQEGQVSRLRVDDNNPMRAVVNIVGYKKPIGASVSKIAVLADSSQRWWNPDLREYPVEVTLDETPPNIKPGLGCQVEILLDRRAKVLGVPLTSIYSQGNQSFVFAREGQGTPKPVEVKIGATNETHAEVTGPVASGQEVLLLQPGQGRQLLEVAGVKVQPVSRPGDVAGKPKGRRGKDGAKEAPVKNAATPAHPPAKGAAPAGNGGVARNAVADAKDGRADKDADKTKTVTSVKTE